MDLGAETAEEVALSILAELVQVRRGRATFVAAPGRRPLAGEPRRRRRGAIAPVVDDIVLLDPVCGMTVDRAHARHIAEHDGTIYAFCSIGCRTRFVKEPARPTSSPASSRRRRPSRPWRPHEVRGHRRDRRAARQGLGVPHGPEPGRQCGPGVESIEVVDETHFKAKAKVGVGFISARFNVDMEIVERDAPDRAVIKAHGQAPGSAVDATARWTSRDGDAGGTTMDWAADVKIAGRWRASARG